MILRFDDVGNSSSGAVAGAAIFFLFSIPLVALYLLISIVVAYFALRRNASYVGVLGLLTVLTGGSALFAVTPFYFMFSCITVNSSSSCDAIGYSVVWMLFLASNCFLTILLISSRIRVKKHLAA
jgi:hypothetical protein